MANKNRGAKEDCTASTVRAVGKDENIPIQFNSFSLLKFIRAVL
jgi:hypothetical protein